MSSDFIRNHPVLTQEISALPRLRVNQRLCYTNVSAGECELIMNFLKKYLYDAQAGLQQAAKQIGVSPNTLTKWRNKLKLDQNYNPKIEYEQLHRAMSPRLEELIIHEIETEYLDAGLFFNNHVLKRIAEAAFYSAPQ